MMLQPIDSEQSWYAVHVHPHAEQKAALHLERQGFATYLPRYLKRRRHARRIETVAAPLFPRYLFVGIDLATQRWRAIQSTVGVVGLVRNGDKPVLVPPRIIGALKNREDERGFIALNDNHRFSAGDKVRVVDGVFSDQLGFFENHCDRDRVTLLLDLLGRKVRVVIDNLSVVAA
jgi:transcriptional antiterminator RfaH